MPSQNPFQQYTATCQLAQANNLQVVDKGDRFLVFRKMPDRLIFVASCRTPASLTLMVKRCAGSARGA